MDFQLMMKRYGPTVHLTPTGELDLETRTALDEVQTRLEGVAAVACDMRHLTFMDVTGLDGLTAFARRLGARGIAFFAYNWQPQPRHLMDLVDRLYPPAGRERNCPTHLLRRSLQDSAAAARVVGAALVQQDADASRRTAISPRRR
ncbi:STAS domain-containing protein [Streptomyces virginiae]|uniref:STAS domain-containing protein n=1 Tax=Streptomyces virginiae TaxID=1961 RepID=UPI002250D29C|nr:STAS domain-containing protein [Streptomyces virginiae]MCX5174519.1 STAS domain-containing protein [Streptomyces virginiae]